MILAITVMATKFSVLRDHWSKHSVIKGKTGTDASLGKDIGGLFILLDWNTKKILKQVNIKNPMGVAFDGSEFYIACMVEDNIAVLDMDLVEIRRISNPKINVPHSVEMIDNKLFVANTGLDEAIILSKNGKEVNHWSALDNGYKLDQFGNTRRIQRDMKHTGITYPTLTQSTHLNYFNKLDNQYFITLFHQGEILKSVDNIHYSMVVTGLKNPHAIRKTTKGYLVSDTRNNQVLFLDNDFKIYDSLNLGFDWIQDAFQTSLGNYIVIDSNNCRILEINKSKEIISDWKVDEEWRLFQAIEIN